MGPTWGSPASCRPQMGPTLAPWTLLSGVVWNMYQTLQVHFCFICNPRSQGLLCVTAWGQITQMWFFHERGLQHKCHGHSRVLMNVHVLDTLCVKCSHVVCPWNVIHYLGSSMLVECAVKFLASRESWLIYTCMRDFMEYIIHIFSRKIRDISYINSAISHNVLLMNNFSKSVICRRNFNIQFRRHHLSVSGLDVRLALWTWWRHQMDTFSA